LRLRFAGRGLVQLATDPDPPIDEAGCTGTHMLHAADAPHYFDRALVWQPESGGNVIVREPRDALPRTGVRVAEISVLVPDGTAQSGYVPLSVMQSSGAVQTSGVQQELQVEGLLDVLTVSTDELLGPGAALGVDLLAKDGRVPYLNGYNHLVWQDGEPIDPFVLAVVADGGGGPPRQVMGREVFNEGLSLMQMSPLQRLLSARGPCGFDGDLSHIPAWARALLTPEEQRLLTEPGFPLSWLRARGDLLTAHLEARLGGSDPGRDDVDAIVSFAERLRLVSVPRGTTVAWLGILLHYGHTISGQLSPGMSAELMLGPLGQRLGARLTVGESDRSEPNGRWLARYAKGVMDTDALTDLVFGELFVPVVAAPADDPIRWERSWTFAAGIRDVVADYACRFNQPFWAQFHVDGDTRTTRLANGTTLTETLTNATPQSYSYSATGFAGVEGYEGTFEAADTAAGCVLTWRCSFRCTDSASIVTVLSTNAAAAGTMTDRLAAHLGPR
jgi:hypothetical protein